MLAQAPLIAESALQQPPPPTAPTKTPLKQQKTDAPKRKHKQLVNTTSTALAAVDDPKNASDSAELQLETVSPKDEKMPKKIEAKSEKK